MELELKSFNFWNPLKEKKNKLNLLIKVNYSLKME